jgi:hypothetical protein
MRIILNRIDVITLTCDTKFIDPLSKEAKKTHALEKYENWR